MKSISKFNEEMLFSIQKGDVAQYFLFINIDDYSKFIYSVVETWGKLIFKTI